MSLQIVSARSNVSWIDELLEDCSGDGMNPWDRVEYLAHGDRDRVRAVIKRADSVVTDISIVRDLANQGGVPIGFVTDDSMDGSGVAAEAAAWPVA